MTPPNESGLRFEREGAIARLTLDRSASGNALGVATAHAIMEAAIACDEDESIRCVVIAGAGHMFCAGGDLGEFQNAGDDIPAYLKRITAYLHSGISRLARMNKPLVTAINGPAAGAGTSLALLGDVAIAARSAYFTLAYTGVGLSPDGGATWLLPRLVGLRRAQEIALTNRRISAEEAASIGLVSRTVEDADFAAAVEETVQALASSATAAIGATRALLLASMDSSLEEQLEREARAIATASRTAHAREGIAAFLAKRRPDFAN